MRRVFRLVLLGFSLVITLMMTTVMLRAQQAPQASEAGSPTQNPQVQRNIEDWSAQQRGVPDDWSHHHLIFSDPGTEQQAIESGNYQQWLNIVNDPRFTLQQIKRSQGSKMFEGADLSATGMRGAGAFEEGSTDKAPDVFGIRTPLPQKPRVVLKKDWAVLIGGAAASAIGTVSNNNASGTSTITVDGQVLTGSAPTAADGSGIFTGAPGPGQGVTITYGSNILTLIANGTASTAVGTVIAPPTSTTAPTITLTNSAGSSPNVLTLTTSATGATATGTVSSTGPNPGDTITIKNGTTSNTLTLTAITGTFGTGTVTISNSLGAANGDVGTVGSLEYIFEESTTAFPGSQFTGAQYYCPNTTNPCVWWGTTEPNTAQALYSAITNNQAQCPTTQELNGSFSVWTESCYAYVTAANASVTASLSTTANTGSVKLTNISGHAIPFTWQSIQNAWSLTPNTGSIPAYAAGTNACTSATAGTFAVSSNPDVVASNIAAAIDACNTAYSAVGVTATVSGNVVTVSSTTLGSPASSLTLTKSASNFVWSTVTSGSSTNGCTSPTTGTFGSGTTAKIASNIAAAINACNTAYPAVGVTASYSTGNTFTVTSTIAGPYLAVGASNNAGLFSWGTVTAGTAGSNSCGSSTSGTFGSSSNVFTLATNLAAAINACPAAVGVTAVASGPVVFLTADTPGTSGNSIALGTTTPNFSWSGADLTGGTDGTTSGTTFAYWSGASAISTAQLAANIATAINENSTLKTLMTATSNGGSTVTVTADTPGTAADSYGTSVNRFSGYSWGGTTFSGGTAGGVVQPNMFPAKYSFSATTASCTDFVVYPTGTAGATGGASIVAFTNLYSGGCSGTVPSGYWAYNTGGTVTTSPVPSLDGTQEAFVQVSGTTASLVLLKWAANSGTAYLPVSPTAATSATYRACTAPCMVTLAFSGGDNDTYSAPYYNYGNDTLYVGDDSGNLHKFSGVFKGTPAEAASAWPVHLGASKISSPVVDPSTGNVIVGDFGGVLHSVAGSSGSVIGLTTSMGDVIADAPLVDGNAGKVYVFVTTCSYNCAGNNAVYELPDTFTSITGASVQPVGTGGAGYYLYSGIFDNVYYSSSTPTGNLYEVGNTGVPSGATLYRIPISNSVMGTPVAAASGLTLSGGSQPWPSPLNEFCNNGTSGCIANATQTTAGTDYVFFSVNRGNVSGCTSAAGKGCVLSYNVSNPASVKQAGTGLTVTTPTGAGCWATGGIVVDNSSALAGASQIYFLGLGSNTAGGPTGTTQTSSKCAAGTAGAVSATQASQSNP